MRAPPSHLAGSPGSGDNADGRRPHTVPAIVTTRSSPERTRQGQLSHYHLAAREGHLGRSVPSSRARSVGGLSFHGLHDIARTPANAALNCIGTYATWFSFYRDV